MIHNQRNGTFRQATFTLLDLAGAERTKSVTEQPTDTTPGGAMMQIYEASKNGPENMIELSLQDQGKLVNYELFEP